MSLVEIWNSSREEIANKHAKQIIGFAGDGQLRDASETSKDFRSFLSIVPSEFLDRYCEDCLSTVFPDSGFTLQDIINQVGVRLGFSVEFGRYRGVRNETGCDGIWRLSDGRSLTVEVKTTDAYRIDLETIWNYRKSLIEAGRIAEKGTAILIIVGRQDTGDLEAQ